MSEDKKIDKEFVPYEVALALKKLGFNEPCFGLYVTLKDGSFELEIFECNPNKKKSKTLSSAPTYQQAFRFFRNKYRLFHEVIIDSEPYVDEPDKLEFSYMILHMVGIEHMYGHEFKPFGTYEEAELACLTRLINIAKGKK